MSAVRAAAALLAILPLASAARADETVTTDFDLAGWRAAGVATIETTIDLGADLAALFDRSGQTGLRALVDGPVELTVDFNPPQAVRRVGLLPADEASYAVSLTLVRADGSRYGLGEKVVGEGAEALFQPLEGQLSRIELEIEALADEPVVHLAELRVGGRLTIDRLGLEGVPRDLPTGGRFPVRVLGRDLLGGRPDVTDQVDLVVTPQRALGLVDGDAVARVAGPITLFPRLRSLEGPARTVMVRALGEAPPKPILYPGFQLVELAIDDPDPSHQHFEILRRESGAKEARSVGLTWGRGFLDTTIEAGKAYHYAIRAVDRYGNPLTQISEEERQRSLTRPKRAQVDVGRLPVLVLLYMDSLDRAGGEPEAIRSGLMAARSFLFRHSGGRLVLDLTVIEMPGPTPDTTGPSMAGITAQLEALAVPRHFGVVFVVANDLTGAHGNFNVLGDMVGAMGRGPGPPTPPRALGADPDVAWVFLHELQHLLSARIGGPVAGRPLPSGDLEQDFLYGPLGTLFGRPFDVGEAWDAQAALIRDGDWWAAVPPPYRLPLEILDSDGDGLADRDPRLPVDEERFGSDPFDRDSDGDGLSDPEELRAGLYGPSNPTHPDSDRDGIPDGADPWPLAHVLPTIPYGTEPQVIARGPGARDPRYALAASWTEEHLIVEVLSDGPRDVFLHLDGSGELGRWETNVGVGAGRAPGSDVWVGESCLALRHEEAPRGVFVAGRPLEGTLLVPSPHPDGVLLRAVLPAALGPGARDVPVPVGAPRVEGLRLEAGTVLGLGVTLRPPSGDRPFNAYGPGWESLLEAHRLYDVVLAPPPEGG